MMGCFPPSGNEYFRRKQYREAVTEYTAGIKERLDDQLLNAVLYTNRAAAQFHLGTVHEISRLVTGLLVHTHAL